MNSEIMKWYEEGDEDKILVLHPDHVEMPILPYTVKHLDLTHTSIEYISDLPANLETLICNNKKLIGIDELPPALRVLNVGNTNIKSIPTLPKSIEILVVTNCGMYCMPKMIHTNLRVLMCGSNFMEKMPELPDTLEILDCIGCAYLTVFERIPMSLTSFNIDFTNYQYKNDQAVHSMTRMFNRMET